MMGSFRNLWWLPHSLPRSEQEAMVVVAGLFGRLNSNANDLPSVVYSTSLRQNPSGNRSQVIQVMHRAATIKHRVRLVRSGVWPRITDHAAPVIERPCPAFDAPRECAEVGRYAVRVKKRVL